MGQIVSSTWRGTSARYIGHKLGIPLNLALDAGFVSSYDGSSQLWNDISGGGLVFNRGATSGAEASDPTFNGVAGRLSSFEYFSSDGGDRFTLSTANPTWVNNLHKNNALFTFYGIFYIASHSASLNGIYGAGTEAGTQITARMYLTAAGKQAVDTWNGSGNNFLFTSTASVPTGAWVSIGVAINEATGYGLSKIGSTYQSFTSTYTSPSASNANNPLQLWGLGATGFSLLNGGRMAVAMFSSQALTQGQFDALDDAFTGRGFNL